jgi:hypothetical protein
VDLIKQTLKPICSRLFWRFPTAFAASVLWKGRQTSQKKRKTGAFPFPFTDSSSLVLSFVHRPSFSEFSRVIVFLESGVIGVFEFLEPKVEPHW